MEHLSINSNELKSNSKKTAKSQELLINLFSLHKKNKEQYLKMQKSIIIIQRCFRQYNLMVNINKSLIISKIISERKNKANKIISLFKKYHNSFAIRKSLIIEKLLLHRSEAINKIQSFIKMKITQSRVKTLVSQSRTHYMLYYPYIAKNVELKVFLNVLFAFTVRKYAFKYEKVLNSFVLFIPYIQLTEGKYKCQLIVDGVITCDGHYSQIEFRNGKFFNIISFKQKHKEEEEESEGEENSISDSDFEFYYDIPPEKRSKKSIGYSMNSSFEELKTNLESSMYYSQMENIQNSCIEDFYWNSEI